MPFKRKTRKPSKSVMKYVQKAMSANKEPHYISTVNIGAGVSTIGTTIGICDIAAGDGINNRTGHEIYLNRLFFRYSVVTGDATNDVRFVLYSKKDSSAADMAITTNDPIDPDQFTVYMDKLCTVNTNNSSKICSGNYRWRGRGKKVIFDGTAYQSQTQGNTKLYIVSDSSVAPNPSISGHVKTWYKE